MKSKYLILALTAVLLLAGVYKIMYTFYNPQTYKMNNVSINAREFIEDKLKSKLPKEATINEVDIEGWHETDLFALVEISESNFDEFKKSIPEITQDSIDESDLNGDIDWWKIKKEECDYKLRQNTPPATYIVLKPQKGIIKVYIKSWVTEKLTDEEWKLFK